MPRPVPHRPAPRRRVAEHRNTPNRATRPLPRRVKVCPRREGRRRVQRLGSRTVHRLAYRIRNGQSTAAKYTGGTVMWIPDGAYTRRSGGSGLGTAVLVRVGVALAAKLAEPVVAAVGELVHVLLVVAGAAWWAPERGACTGGAMKTRPAPWLPPAACGPPGPSHRRSSERSSTTTTSTSLAWTPPTWPPSSGSSRRAGEPGGRAAGRPWSIQSLQAAALTLRPGADSARSRCPRQARQVIRWWPAIFAGTAYAAANGEPWGKAGRSVCQR